MIYGPAMSEEALFIFEQYLLGSLTFSSPFLCDIHFIFAAMLNQFHFLNYLENHILKGYSSFPCSVSSMPYSISKENCHHYKMCFHK